MYYIGVDGGGSKTKFCLTNEVGKLISCVELGASNYLQIGFDGITTLVEKGVNELLINSKITKEEIKFIFLGICAYGDVKKEEIIIQKAIEKGLNGIPFEVKNDSYNALAAGLCGESGINIICGTGSAARGYNAETNLYESSGGWLYTFGSDEASGYWLANRLLNEFARQSDGRDPKTLLYQAVKDFLHLNDDGEVISVVATDWNNDRSKVAAVSKLYEKLAKNNDPFALKILDEAGKEIADMLKAIYTKLNFQQKVKVSYSGGVFNLKDYILNPLRNNLDANKMEVNAPILSPTAGAVLLALKHDNIKITNEVIQNLKEI